MSCIASPIIFLATARPDKVNANTHNEGEKIDSSIIKRYYKTTEDIDQLLFLSLSNYIKKNELHTHIQILKCSLNTILLCQLSMLQSLILFCGIQNSFSSGLKSIKK